MAPAMAEAPRRVVSFNQCGDQLVLALADPGQIAGLSPYAADPTLSAVAEKGPDLEILAVTVTNAQEVPCSPCGACRQVIYEFGPNAVIFYQGQHGWTKCAIAELLPEGFRLK